MNPQLGDLTVRRFLRRHWQREPVLIRQVWSGLTGSGEVPPFTLTPRELFALARDPDVESRLVLAADVGSTASRSTSGWELRYGPFTRLPPRRQRGWSLLVQGVDLHLEAARDLMDRFRFIPDARLDDLMVSFATDGGGVGPHVDSYDVFLLQIAGRRRWRVSTPGPVALVPNAPLRLLADFEPEQTWLLEAGDMLYLPPGWGHEGTAVGDCLTCSIGFRSPSVEELRRAFFGFLADGESQVAESGAAPAKRYRDRTVRPAMNPARIPSDMAKTLTQWLSGYRPPGRLIERFIGCFLTEPKPSVWFERDQESGPEDVEGCSLTLDRRSRMLYRGDAFYLNGEAVELPAAASVQDTTTRRTSRALLRKLADQRSLDAVQTAKALHDPWLRDRIGAWLATGWIRRAGS